MGRSGIRRRKPAHHLPKSHEHYSADDMAGAFGNFRWSAYTPAGTVERAGFVTRRTLRSRRHPEWNECNRKTKLMGEALLVIPYFAVLVIMFGVLIDRVLGS